MVRNTGVLAAVTCLLTFAAGCSHSPQADSSTPSDHAAVVSGQEKFLTHLQSLPLEQRPAYVQANYDTVRSLDTAGAARVQSLMQQRN